MENLQCWIATYGVFFKKLPLGYGYAQMCDELIVAIEKDLNQKFSYVSYVEDERDGEELSVRFRITVDYDLNRYLPTISPIKIAGKSYEVELGEVKRCEEVYQKTFTAGIKKFVDCLNKTQVPFSALAFKLLSEAIECYKSDLDDAAVIMCRTAIDSSIYLASIWVPAGDSNAFDGFEKRTPYPFQDIRKVDWSQLKKVCITLRFFDELELNDINDKTRDLGNFAAHLGERQIKETNEWMSRYGNIYERILARTLAGEKVDPREFPPAQKLYTSKGESSFAIESTMKFLCSLAERYINPLK